MCLALLLSGAVGACGVGASPTTLSDVRGTSTASSRVEATPTSLPSGVSEEDAIRIARTTARYRHSWTRLPDPLDGSMPTRTRKRVRTRILADSCGRSPLPGMSASAPLQLGQPPRHAIHRDRELRSCILTTSLATSCFRRAAQRSDGRPAEGLSASRGAQARRTRSGADLRPAAAVGLVTSRCVDAGPKLSTFRRSNSEHP